jgi:hypothetical protein
MLYASSATDDYYVQVLQLMHIVVAGIYCASDLSGEYMVQVLRLLNKLCEGCTW